jgi:hypothetical protein
MTDTLIIAIVVVAGNLFTLLGIGVRVYGKVQIERVKRQVHQEAVRALTTGGRVSDTRDGTTIEVGGRSNRKTTGEDHAAR